MTISRSAHNNPRRVTLLRLQSPSRAQSTTPYPTTTPKPPIPLLNITPSTAIAKQHCSSQDTSCRTTGSEARTNVTTVDTPRSRSHHRVASTATMADDQTINLPQLVIILLLGGFAVRYFFFSTPQSPGQQSTSSRGGVRVRDADVDRVQQMFPQVGRRTIMWDLQRNGGNIAATTERILSGRGLEEVSCRIPADPFQLATAHQLTPYTAATDFPTTHATSCSIFFFAGRHKDGDAKAIPARPDCALQPCGEARRSHQRG